RALIVEYQDLRLDDWLDGLRTGGQSPIWMQLSASRLSDGKAQARTEKLIDAWVRQLAASACGHAVQGVLIGVDARVDLPPLPADEARDHLHTLLAAWQEGMRRPLPFTARTALAELKNGKGQEVYEGGYSTSGEVEEPCLARTFPDFASLSADGRFETYQAKLFQPLFDWAARAVVIRHGQTPAAGTKEAA
ncbi:MAG: exodeoxyribonuclease V subunit gamma, partial [Thiomonas arsenitoxydans]|nr:exodeoxyribonuclease V subunit gamma [Thiomonas arsenitoxydans]